MAVHSHDFIHNAPFWFRLPSRKFHDGFGGWPGKSAIRGGTVLSSARSSDSAWRHKLILVTSAQSHDATNKIAPISPIHLTGRAGTSPVTWP
jgi:hypothetical protein